MGEDWHCSVSGCSSSRAIWPNPASSRACLSGASCSCFPRFIGRANAPCNNNDCMLPGPPNQRSDQGACRRTRRQCRWRTERELHPAFARRLPRTTLPRLPCLSWTGLEAHPPIATETAGSLRRRLTRASSIPDDESIPAHTCPLSRRGLHAMESRHDSQWLQHITRRHFFRDCQLGLGSLALASLLDDRPDQAAPQAGPALKTLHHPAEAKAVIFLFMAGGPSQLELFDYMPKLQELHGQVIPE